MFKQLSFLQHPMPVIVANAVNTFSGAVQVTGVYYNERLNGLQACSFDLKSQRFNSDVIMNFDWALNHRITRNNKIWLSENDVNPNSTKNKNGFTQVTLEAEFDNNVLLLKFPNEQDKKQDLLFITFNKAKNNFEMESKSQPLDTNSKGIIGHLLYNSLSSFIQVHNQNAQVYAGIIESNKLVQNENQQTKSELSEANEKLKNYQQSLYGSFIKSAEREYERIIKFSDEAFDKLARFKGHNTELEQIVKSAINIGINLAIPGGAVTIEASYIHFEEYHEERESNIVQTDVNEFSRYAKTIQLLDRYEKAARSVLQNGLKLTSKNVGQHCSPPISAPAISDSLKKGRNKINTLLERHPEKWTSIRNNFKPIKNIAPKGPLLGGVLIGA